MYITISRSIGSGKSTVSKILSERLGFELVSTGKIFRQMAKDMGLTLMELTELANEDPKYDFKVDIEEILKTTTSNDIIFDSRLAWHFIEPSFKIFLLCDLKESANRIFSSNIKDLSERKSSATEVLNDLISRRYSEISRYKKYYDVNINNLLNYDLIIDVAKLDDDSVVQIIQHEINNHRDYTVAYLDPCEMFPTKGFRDYNLYKLDEMLNDIKHLDNRLAVRYITEDTMIDSEFENNSIFIINGHLRHLASLCSFDKLIATRLTESTESPRKMPISIIYDLEEASKNKFKYIPSEYK